MLGEARTLFGRVFERVRQDLGWTRQLLATSRRHWTTGRRLRRQFHEAKRTGRKIVLDEFGPPIPAPGAGEPAADLSPNTDLVARKQHTAR